MATKPLSAPEVQELATGLNRLARNLWWSWDQEAQEIFAELSPRGWQNLYHNAVAILREVSDYELRIRLQDPRLAAKVRSTLARFDGYLHSQETWGLKHAPQLVQNPVAYFSAEFAFHETLPIAAGGLGALAGDHAKSASDLGIGFIGISLFYREGYFMQGVNHENWQTESYHLLNPANLPMEPVLDARGERLTGTITIAASTVTFQAWRVNVGRIPVYLLDTNVPQNEPHYRDLSLRVYGGDSTTRIMQEILLGVGGVRLLRSLGYQPSTFHMNEGHAAFLTLELLREKMAAGKTLTEAEGLTKQECIFTTHTPVEAGHDRFSSDLMSYAASQFGRTLGLAHEQVMGLGRVVPADAKEPFCMTVLALRYSRAANGVSELHGAVSREMWKEFFGKEKAEDVPIGHITNGIHLVGWIKGTARKVFMSKFHEIYPEKNEQAWFSDANSQDFWNQMADPTVLSDEELWAMRYRMRRELLEFTRRRLLLQGGTFAQGDFITFDSFLNPDALTIGFARRFATYKRAPLIFDQLENIVRLVKDKSRPVQFVFAGKAHPRDDSGKAFIQKIIHLSKFSELKGSLVFIENYDIHVCRQMVAGCDIWLNNPRRPLEASGTSGMKTTAHGCLNLSILDGWWREGYDKTDGFAIGPDSHPDDVREQDRVDSANLYATLTEEVVPEFFNRDANGVPRRWIARIRRAWVKLAAEYSTWRMVQEYTNKYYLTK
ncbi:MAG TPA: alpha-glucan family phosphorylase [Candidatus Limnocylindria bacterium]|nr:alpha-glucan family phosphorylase [Candidatus Limnocylindria bacterium]